nr:MAG TPA: hypothetical protein [Caudoviricetes sp.]
MGNVGTLFSPRIAMQIVRIQAVTYFRSVVCAVTLATYPQRHF